MVPHEVSSNNDGGDINPQAAARICSHMNDDHAATVHSMARSSLRESGSKTTNGNGARPFGVSIQNAKMTSVSLSSYSLSFVCCNGNTCSMEKRVVKFDPPLDYASEVKTRLIQEHHRVLTPQFKWLLEDPLCIIILSACATLGLLHHEVIGGVDDYSRLGHMMGNLIPPSVSRLVLPSTAVAKAAVKWSWFFGVVAHFCEAVYVVYLCRTKLKLRFFPATIKWFVLCCCVGYPMTTIVTNLVAVDRKAREQASKRRSNDGEKAD